jgi:serine/threonine-protein kinase
MALAVALTPGTHLGPYEITALVGAGGMGEVYKAIDTRLHRTVAVKVLPADVASDSDLKQRLEREAKAISSLNHPHICTLHDVGSQDGIDFLVLEYLEGETLAQRLTKGPLPLDQALQYAIQLADALARAHHQGIVHRDLKPGNVMLTKSGAKLLDFGLAKPRPLATVGSAGTSAAQTVTSPLTSAGTIVGTIQYMAPEQLEGKDADARTDIFAFGVVLYEMLTGKKAFEGKSQASLIAAILAHQPSPPSATQRLTPATVDHIVATCLAKDPDERWQSASDLRRQLIWISGRSEASPAGVSSRTSSTPRTLRIWTAAGLTGLAIGAAAMALVRIAGRDSTPPPLEVSRLIMSVAPADQLRSFPDDQGGGEGLPSRTVMAIAPDGRSLVFSAVRGNQQQLYRRRLTELEATPIGGTDGAHSPFFSPDGRWLGFITGQSLRKIAFPEVGPATSVWAEPSNFNAAGARFFGASWGADDTIVIGQRAGGLLRVSSGGGNAEPLTTLDTTLGEFSHRLPFVLPGGRAVLFTVTHAQFPRWDSTDVVVQSMTSGERKVLIKGGADARYVASGHLVYMRVGTLMAVPFDLERLEVGASPVAVAADVMQAAQGRTFELDSGAGQFSVSPSGTLVYLPGGLFPAREQSLLWVDRAGAEQPFALPPQSFSHPRLSPDGQRVVFGTLPLGERNVYIADLRRSGITRVTDDGRSEGPIWTPDGKRIVFTSFVSAQGNRADIASKSADGSGPIERLSSRSHAAYAHSWTPDGTALAFTERRPEDFSDIWVLPLKSDRQPEAIVSTRFAEAQPDISPNGRWLAYTSDESGRQEVFVRSYPEPGTLLPISTGGANSPAWSRDGRELFFTTLPTPESTLSMMVVDVTTAPTFTAGKPRVLFEGRFRSNSVGRQYDVAGDGSRFLMMREVERPPETPAQMIVVQNWLEELKQRVPTRLRP